MGIEEPKRTPTLAVALAWVVVLIPLTWGSYTSIKKSLLLFRVEGKAAARP